jgi:hypothetical protein
VFAVNKAETLDPQTDVGPAGGLGSHARTLVTVVASQRPLPIDGAADNLPNLRIRQE